MDRERHNPGDIYEIRLREWNGRPIDKTKFTTTEQGKAAIAITRIMDNCNLSFSKIEELKHSEIKQESNNQVNLRQSINKPIQWKRDARGNII